MAKKESIRIPWFLCPADKLSFADRLEKEIRKQGGNPEAIFTVITQSPKIREAVARIIVESINFSE